MINNIKYSFIIPYYKRFDHFNITLDSFSTLYGSRNDLEIIVVEDQKNILDLDMHYALLRLQEAYKLNIRILPFDKICYNPAPKYNLGVDSSLGSILILTNPECPHVDNILNYLDTKDLKNDYVVFSCRSVDVTNWDPARFSYSENRWYQHSKHDARCLHFCSAISKESYSKIGGFDEGFSDGIAYEDDDFIRTIRLNKINVIQEDSLLTLHLNHDSSYQGNNPELCQRNARLLYTKWGY